MRIKILNSYKNYQENRSFYKKVPSVVMKALEKINIQELRDNYILHFHIDNAIENAMRYSMSLEDFLTKNLYFFTNIYKVSGLFVVARDINMEMTIFTVLNPESRYFKKIENLQNANDTKEIIKLVESIMPDPFKSGVKSLKELEFPFPGMNETIEDNHRTIFNSIDNTPIIKNSQALWFANKMDIDDYPFGMAGGWFENNPPNNTSSLVLSIRELVESFDNYVYELNLSRLKQKLVTALSDALKDKLLINGFQAAISILHKYIDFTSMLLLYHDESDMDLATLKYILYDMGKIYDPYHNYDQKIHNSIMKKGITILRTTNNRKACNEIMVIGDYHEELLITGVKKTQSVGKIILSSSETDFDTFEKDLLEFFIAFIRQRIVDFNKEWRNLSRFFPISYRTRLLETPNYRYTLLTPRKKEIAILYADISGFTMISEQILKDPDDIAKLIDIWSTECVHAIWRQEGCFDKLVGDCVIALFAPPFYDNSDSKNCNQCLNTAFEIRKITKELYEKHPADCFEKLRKSTCIDEMNVSIGLNFGSVFVGISGPNDDFSCYSSVMNNAARIQGAAGDGQIFAIKDFADKCTLQIKKDGPFSKKLKNVSHPLEYYSYEN